MINQQEEAILLIEDNPGDIRLMKEMLNEITSFKYQLIVAETLKGGCELIRNIKVILILLDLNLPDSRGKQTFDAVLGIADAIPVVLVSGLQDVELSLSLIKEGAQDYLVKQDLNRILLEKTIRYAIERKKAEEALQSSKNFLDKIINTVASPIFVKDINHKLVLVNDAFCAFIGIPAKAIIGKTGYETFPKEQFEEYIEKDKEVFITGQENINEEFVTVGNGLVRTVITRKTLYIDLEGNKFLVGIVNDITERRHVEQEILLKNAELAKFNLEKDKFFTIIAHDLRGPFNNFLGFTKMMAEDLPSLTLDEIQKISVSMMKSATNLYGLLENLLEWSRIQRGITSFEPKPFLLLPAIEQKLLTLLETAKKKGIKISFQIPETLSISSDVNMFGSIIQNLATNAVKFTPKGGRVDITANPAENSLVEISIRDTGIGINQEMLGRLFTLDEQPNRKGTDGEPSTGLGLIICKEFIEKHGGKIRVESEEGKGSAFTLSLPATDLIPDT